jgi:hypothetical protein
MPEQNKQENKSKTAKDVSERLEKTMDQAEGEEETVDEALRQHEENDKQ